MGRSGAEVSRFLSWLGLQSAGALSAGGRRRRCRSRSRELIHVPNTWHTEAQGQWAKLLSERSFGGQAFFCNSGTEANEAAIKLARLHTPRERYKIITFEGGFHGRTWAAVERHRSAEVSRRHRAAGRRFRLRTVWRSRRGAGEWSTTRRRRSWSSRFRAKGAIRIPPGRVPRRAAARSPTSTACC